MAGHRVWGPKKNVPQICRDFTAIYRNLSHFFQASGTATPPPLPRGDRLSPQKEGGRGLGKGAQTSEPLYKESPLARKLGRKAAQTKHVLTTLSPTTHTSKCAVCPFCGNVRGGYPQTPVPSPSRTLSFDPSREGLGWVGLGWVKASSGRAASVGARSSVTQGPHNSRSSGPKAYRTVDRPQPPRRHTREGGAAVLVCVARVRAGEQARRHTIDVVPMTPFPLPPPANRRRWAIIRRRFGFSLRRWSESPSGLLPPSSRRVFVFLPSSSSLIGPPPANQRSLRQNAAPDRGGSAGLFPLLNRSFTPRFPVVPLCAQVSGWLSAGSNFFWMKKFDAFAQLQ